MQMSKRKIKKAYQYINDPIKVHSMKKYVLIEELKDYGVTVDMNSDIDAETMQKIFFLVLERVVGKYKREEVE